jgi:folylpolyglutamate synthase/dihydropteroate synthase
MRSAGIRDVSECGSVRDAVDSAMKQASAEGGTVLVTGSLFLVAEALEIFEGVESTGRGLNEGILKKC